MNKSIKKGFSLIVLATTIAITITIAAVVILIVNNTGMIERANQARAAKEWSELEDAASVIYSDYVLGRALGQDPTAGRRVGQYIRDELINQGFTLADTVVVKDNGELLDASNMPDGLANEPDLKTGMIAVNWNGTNWAKADESNIGNPWYDYTKGINKWANAVTVKESGTKQRAYYLSAAIGTVIPEEDILSMWVWIPSLRIK